MAMNRTTYGDGHSEDYDVRGNEETFKGSSRGKEVPESYDHMMGKVQPSHMGSQSMSPAKE